MLAPRRLPGIRVDVAPPPVAEALPRMDVAVFAGFASTGPLHVPVPITSVPHFAAVFGRDAPLARDAQRGERLLAYLGAAVRGFFANGGRRCWVIRVARTEALEAVRHALQPSHAALPIASANRFPVAGVLEVSASGGLAPALVRARSEGSWSDGLRLATALQQRTVGISNLALDPSSCEFHAHRRIDAGELIELRDGTLRVFAVVEDVLIHSVEAAAPYRVTANYRASFERLDPGALSPFAPLAGEIAAPGLDSAVPAELSATSSGLAVRFSVPAAQVPRVSQWLRFDSGSEVTWFQVESINQRPADSVSPGGGALTESEVEVQGTAWRQLDAMPLLFGIDRVYCSSLEMRAENVDDDELARLGSVGLAPGGTNPWWRQTTDEDIYRVALENRVDTLAGPDAPVTRFPFAPLGGQAPLAWIPLGVDALFNDGLGPLPQAASALERDGLADFDASLFLDPELAGLATQDVVPRAETIRFLREQTRTLFGIHAALAIGSGGLSGECSLVCTPDAVHLGWRRQELAEPPGAHPADEADTEPDYGAFLDCGTRSIDAPVLTGPARVESAQAWQLSWSASEGGAQYDLEESQQADLGDARTIYSGDLTQYTVVPPRDGIFYYRVHARAGTARSAGSNVVIVQVGQDPWQQLDAATFAAEGEPELLRLHRAVLRLCASSGELFAILALPRHYRTPQALRYSDRLRTLNGSGVPGNADSFAQFEARTLSCAALYHPWTVCGTRPPPNLAPAAAAVDTRIIPPDGLIAGTFAARATQRGAWVAPANELLAGVVALTPEVEPADWQAFQDAAINLVRDDARGFIVLSADTLSTEAELQLINVRRLLILLRRLALRRGISYVFEPNGPALRRAVQRGFTVLLADLFRRGAFAGRTPQQSFRVVTDDTVNTRIDNDAGRFIVELRIAPSLPLRFLTLLLAQSGERLTVTEEL